MKTQEWNIAPANPEVLENIRRRLPSAFKHDPSPIILTTGDNQEGLAWMGRNDVDYGPDDRLIQIIVQPPFRRKGLGTRLFHALTEEASRRKIKRLIHAGGIRTTTFGTPPPEARFMTSLGGTPVRQLDTFHLDRPSAEKLIPRLNTLTKRLPDHFHWIPAHTLDPDTYSAFFKEHIEVVPASAHPSPPPEHPILDEIAIAALEKANGPIAGLIIPGPSRELAATLDYHLFAISPAYRRTALASALLARSIGKALEGTWKQSRFHVFKNPASAMWRFANRNAHPKGSLITYGFEVNSQ